MTPTHDKLLSNDAFNCNLRHYTEVVATTAARSGGTNEGVPNNSFSTLTVV